MFALAGSFGRMSASNSSGKRRIFMSESTMCCCGHPYGDHLAKAPHRCTEDHATKAGHRCSCDRFQPPAGAFPDALGTHADRTLQAASSGVSMTFQRILSGLPGGDGFGFPS